MRALFLTVLFLFSKEFYFAGCGAPRMSTDNGVYFGSWGWKHNGWDTLIVNPSDSFSIKINGGSCYQLREVIIYFNKSVIHKCNDVYCVFKLESKPGVYEIHASNTVAYSSYWNIVLLPKIYKADTVLSHENYNGAIPNLYPQSLIYPNPAQDEITFLSELEEIKSIHFYNSIFQLLVSYSPNLRKVTIPLSDFPRGVYFVQVATLSEKIILKKVILQ